MSEPNVEPASAAPVSFWRTVVQSLGGKHFDYTQERLGRAVFLLAVPMVLEMFMESLFAIADVFWVSRLGADAIAVIGITESVMTLIYAVAIGISIAATAIVSRRIGEKDPEGAAHAAGQIVLLGIGVAAGIGMLLGAYAPEILRAMGAEEKIVVLGSDFARIMLGGNVTVFLIFLINAIFRGAGDAVLAMRTLWLANALNIVLGPCFIFGLGPFPEMGVTGAAVATNIGRGVGVLYQLWHLAGHQSRVRVRLRHMRADMKLIVSVLRTAGSGIAQLLISTTSWVGLTIILTSFGSAAVAGNTIAIRIVMFALLPAFGLANAAATLVGQNLGAESPKRAEDAVWIATRYNTAFLGIVGIFFVAFAWPIARLFTADPEVLAYAARALWIVSLAFPLYAAGMCLESAFNGAGDTWTPTWLNFFCFWLLQIPLAWVLATPGRVFPQHVVLGKISFDLPDILPHVKGVGLGPIGVFIAVPISFSVLALWSAVLFRRGKWKLKRV